MWLAEETQGDDSLSDSVWSIQLMPFDIAGHSAPINPKDARDGTVRDAFLQQVTNDLLLSREERVEKAVQSGGTVTRGSEPSI